MFRKFSILYTVACVPSLALIAWGSALASENDRRVVPSADLHAWAAEDFGAGDVLPKLTGETPVAPFSFMYDWPVNEQYIDFGTLALHNENCFFQTSVPAACYWFWLHTRPSR